MGLLCFSGYTIEGRYNCVPDLDIEIVLAALTIEGTRTMAPGGIMNKEEIEPRIACLKHDTGHPATSDAELRGSPLRKAATPSPGNPGKQSASNMQDLLDCPVCFTVMHPPIFQVCSCQNVMPFDHQHCTHNNTRNFPI